MKNVLSTVIVAASMLVSTASFAGVLGDMSADSSQASTASKNSIEASLSVVSTELKASAESTSKQSGRLVRFFEDASIQSVKQSERTGKMVVKFVSKSIQFSLELAVAGSETSVKMIQTAYQEGRKMDVTVINPEAIRAAAGKGMISQSAAVSGHMSNKASETAVSAAVSVLVSAGEIVISPSLFKAEYDSVRAARKAMGN